ncbi:MAG: hypothetical protein ACR2J1_00040 [Methyloceanibacter sp.]|uniref:hypothetical protein n=1 Tax=Methyloceanibacter sp. TaxID=1965321 RepID=UPI003D9AFDB2
MRAENDTAFWSSIVKSAEQKYTDHDAVCAVCLEAWELIKRGLPLPEPISSYVANILSQKIVHAASRQGGAGRNGVRDAFISQAILQLNRELGLRPSQSFSLVARVLKSHGHFLTSRGVRGVWERKIPRGHKFSKGRFVKKAAKRS